MILSVIIPIYNVEKYVEKCIYSIINNNLKSTDYEIIVVDDESKDTSLKIVNQISESHLNIKIISQKNKGLGGARNTGIQNSIGKFILFLDSDDWILPHSLQQIVDIALLNDLEILEFGAQGISEKGVISYTKSTTSENQILSGTTYYNKIRYMDSACNKLYNRNFLVNNNLFFLEKIFIEDYEFNTRTFLIAQKVMAISTIAAHFLQSENSITRNLDVAKKNKMQNDIVFVMKTIQKLSTKSLTNTLFFQQRLAFLNATLFYQLIKNKAAYSEFLNLKSELQKQEIFVTNCTIFDKKKNLFRIVFLKHFYLFNCIRFIK